MPTFPRLDEIETFAGYFDADLTLLDEYRRQLEITARLHVRDRGEGGAGRNRFVTQAAAASIQTANALLAAMNLRCSLAHPPADIDLRQDNGGNIVYRCYHHPSHQWRLDGTLK